MKMRLRPWQAVVITAVLALGFSTVAASNSPAYPVSGSGDHCVAHLEHITPGGPEARITKETCFKTFSEAMRFVDG